MSNEILNFDKYTNLTVENERGKKIAVITSEGVTTADGYVVRLIPKYD